MHLSSHVITTYLHSLDVVPDVVGRAGDLEDVAVGLRAGASLGEMGRDEGMGGAHERQPLSAGHVGWRGHTAVWRATWLPMRAPMLRAAAATLTAWTMVKEGG